MTWRATFFLTSPLSNGANFDVGERALTASAIPQTPRSLKRSGLALRAQQEPTLAQIDEEHQCLRAAACPRCDRRRDASGYAACSRSSDVWKVSVPSPRTSPPISNQHALWLTNRGNTHHLQGSRAVFPI